MTTRRLMIVVLVVAALLTVFEAGRRWERAEKAVTHSTAAPHWRGESLILTSPNDLAEF
jgi:hypothetical protein